MRILTQGTLYKVIEVIVMMIYELRWLFLVGQFRHHTFPFCAHRYPPSHVSHLLLSSLQHVRTSASGLLRFPDDGLKITPSTIHKVYDGLAGLEEGEEEGRPCPVLQRGGDENHSQSRWKPSSPPKTLSSPPSSPPPLSSSLPLHITLTRTNGLIGWKDRICQQLMRSASALQQTKGFSGECDWRTRRLILPSNLKIYFAIMGRYPNTSSGRRNRCVVKFQCCNTIEYLRRMKVRSDKVLQLV